MNTNRLLRRMAVTPILAMAVLGFASGTADAAPGVAYTCTGGPVPAGVYSSLAITGDCVIDAGAVTVTGNVSVGPTSSARLTVAPVARLLVKGNLTANGAGAVDLSCYAFSDCVSIAGNVAVSGTSYARLSGITVGGKRHRVRDHRQLPIHLPRSPRSASAPSAAMSASPATPPAWSMSCRTT